MKRIHRAACIASVAVAAAALGAGVPAVASAPPTHLASAGRSSTTAPTVAIFVQATDASTFAPLRTQLPISAAATPSAGRTIASVAFEYSPAGMNTWSQPFDTENTPQNGNIYIDSSFDTSKVPNGDYDIRAVATDSAGAQAAAVAPDRVIANSATFVALGDPGTPVHGSLQLTAEQEQGGFTPTHVTFEISRAGAGQWSKIATVGPQLDSSGFPTGIYVTTLDTSTVPDGSYDLMVTADDAPSIDGFVGEVLRRRLIDNTPPAVTLTTPGVQLAGVAPLPGAAQDAGSGVAAVRFQSAPAGTGAWTTIGVATRAPYSTDFDTRTLANGSYDLRAEATDAAGNTADSPVASGVSISNPSPQRFDAFALTKYAAPATNISLLGEVAGSAQHETWAYGYTNAPPPIVNGAPLPYTTEGAHQLVLLRYDDATGWEIADVLRNADGSPYSLLSPSQLSSGGVSVSGQMTPSGEAWIVMTQVPTNGHGPVQVAVFHRLPGGPFALDQAATATLAPLLPTSGQGPLQQVVRLGETGGGAVYGLMLAPSQPQSSAVVNAPAGPVSINTALQYGSLAGGSWTIQSAPLPPGYVPPPFGDTVSLAAADPTGPGTGWAGLSYATSATPLPTLANFDAGGWHFVSTGLDALDQTGAFGPSPVGIGAFGQTVSSLIARVTPTAIRADSGGVWVAATVQEFGSTGDLVARYDAAGGQVTGGWCERLPMRSIGCAQPLDLAHPATVPDATFATPQGPVADALGINFVDVYSYGRWTSVAVPGFQGNRNGGQGQSLFVDPTDGWLVGANVIARISPSPTTGPLTSWPEANRAPLLSVALPPGQSTTDTPGALAVGLNGTALHYDGSAGWQVDPTPPQAHHIGLYSVAFNGPSSAFAVGQEGTILHWDGTKWTADPQSISLTTAALESVAFDVSGQGWAVGALGTILRYDGTAWSQESPDAADSGAQITSVAVSGSDVFALAGGNLIERQPDGTWQRVDPSLLPSPAPPQGTLSLLAGLPDGGLVVAGKSLLMIRQSSSAKLQYAAQTFQGIPVALAPFRDASGNLNTFVSVAPPVTGANGLTSSLGGFPAGDGDLILQSAGGWNDLSRADDAAQQPYALGDGAVHPDPVLAVAASPDGSHAWVVGGYAGTHAADGVGTDTVLPARAPGWLTSAVWRYDAGGSVAPPGVTQGPASLPAVPGTVSFAFFSSPVCKAECAAVQDAQPDVNLGAAAAQIAAFAQQPGGPAFAMLGGNARGGNAPVVDLSHLPGLLAPLGSLPLYAAYGPLDAVSGGGDPALPWASAFGGAPAPFGSGGAPAGITPAGSGDPSGQVNKYYAFDVTQNAGKLRVIVLDNSSGSLEASAPGQTAWLDARLAEAQAAGLPVVVVAARPLNSAGNGPASDGDAVAAKLAAAGVLGVFSTSGGSNGNWQTQTDRVVQVPAAATPGAPQIPEYEGATLTYQQPQNHGVTWYEVSVDTVANKLAVKAIPVVSSLALEPLGGLSVVRSSTLSFAAIGRRAASTVATTPIDDTFPGYDNYVGIPSSNCSGCVGPSYSFKSSNPVIGDFVAPVSAGSSFPKLSGTGKPIPSSTSGLLCAYNAGSTTVTVTAGLESASLPVSVTTGAIGQPCGTVAGGSNQPIVTPRTTITTTTGNPGGLSAPPPPPPTPIVSVGTTAPIKLPVAPKPVPSPVAVVPAPPAHKPGPTPHKPPPPHRPPPPPPQQQQPPVPSQSTGSLSVPPVVLPLIPPPVTPVPPGGATVSAQAAARREEKARKHASQSAYTIRPAGTSGTDWFYPAVGVLTLMALVLAAQAMPPRTRPRFALQYARDEPGRAARRRV